jgi:small subunit ribosomal protein S13
MPRILGIDIPEQKKVKIALRYLYGVGASIANDVLAKTNIDGEKRASALTADEINRIQRSLEEYPLEGDLRRLINDNIDRLRRIKAYRGLRHIAKLPVRGQRTRSNSRTVRGGGKRKTVGAMSKELATKLEEAKKV